MRIIVFTIMMSGIEYMISLMKVMTEEIISDIKIKTYSLHAKTLTIELYIFLN